MSRALAGILVDKYKPIIRTMSDNGFKKFSTIQKSLVNLLVNKGLYF